MTDPELIARVLVADDHAAFGELVRRHQSAVRHFLRHLAAGDAALADDLAQETFLQAHRSLRHFRGGSRFLTWLLGIAHNHFRNARRHAALRRTETLPDYDLADSSAPSPTRAADLHHDLTATLRQLSSEQQSAIHLCYRQGLTHEEAAAVLNCPLGTLKSNLSRAKNHLRQLLATWNPQI